MQLRPPLVALALAVLSPAAPAFGDDLLGHEAAAALSIYADDDHVTVISPAATARVQPTERVVVQADFTLDEVSAASIDVVSHATTRTMQERRYEGELAVSAAPWRSVPDLTVSGRAIGSTENDYDALTLGAGLKLEAFERHTTFLLDYAAGFDRVGRAGDPSFSRGRDSHRLIATVTQVLDARTLVDAVLDVTLLHGYQASPYRYVPIVDPSGTRLYSLPEALPEDRWTAAALVRARRALGARPWLYLHGDARLYRDGWGIQSQTVSARAVVPLFDERLTLYAEGRGYFQGAADFYESRYVDEGHGAPSVRTRDRVLGRMRTLGGELGGELGLGGLPRAPVLRLFGAASVLHFDWLDFEPQRDRTALVTTLGATASF